MNIINKNNIDRASVLQLTNDQQIVYDNLIDWIDKPYNPNDTKRALVGPAGTGKTFLVKTLIKNCNLNYSQIGLAAPTHKACRVLHESISLPNINVNTLQSDLGLRLNFDIEKFDVNNPPFDPKGRIKIGDYNLYIIDESSMINHGLVIFLEKICKSNNCKVLYIGDSYQLAPVGEYKSAAFSGVKTYELKQIVRQSDDNPITPLLEMLRRDIIHNSFNFVNYVIKNPERFDEYNTKGYKVCSPREFEDIVYNNFNDENITNNVDFAKVIGYTNVCVSGWNKFVRNSIIEDADKSVITKNDLIISYTTIVDKFNGAIIKNSEEYILKDVVNYIHPKYELKGFLVRFIAIHGGKVTQPLFILDHNDKTSVLRYMQLSNSFIDAAKQTAVKFRAQRWKDYFAFKEGCLLLTNICNRKQEILFSRDLDYGFSLTAHKSQGSTFDTVLIDLMDILYDKNGRVYTNAEEINRRLYVACSRCKNKLFLKYGYDA